MARILTHEGTCCLVDDIDEDRWAPYSWGTDKDGYVCAYFQTRPGKVYLIRLHRLIAIPDASQFVHHKNRWVLDNRRENLQCVTPLEHAKLHPGNEDLQAAARIKRPNWHMINLCRIEAQIRARAVEQSS